MRVTVPSSVTPVTQQWNPGLGDPGWVKGGQTEAPELPCTGTPSPAPSYLPHLLVLPEIPQAKLFSPRDPILHPWEPEEPEPTPAFQGRGTPLPPHPPVLAPELRLLSCVTQILQMVLGARSCSISSPGRGRITALLPLLSPFQLPFPHPSSPAAVAELQGWDAPHVPLAPSHHYPGCN